MIDLQKFTTEAERLKEWDSDGENYGYELDVEYLDGMVRGNINGPRQQGADRFQEDVQRIIKDENVGRIYVRLYRGMSTTAKRMNKGFSDNQPDFILRIRNSSNTLPTPRPVHNSTDNSDTTMDGTKAGMDIIAQLMGLGNGLSGVDMLNGIMETRIGNVRKDMEYERLKERYEDECKKYEQEAQKRQELEKDIAALEGERDELESRVSELERYDPHSTSGLAAWATHIGSVTLGNIARNFALKNPQKAAGLLGPDALTILGVGGEREQQQPNTPEVNPKVAQITSWLNKQSPRAVEQVYWLVATWDGAPSTLGMVCQWLAHRNDTQTTSSTTEEEATGTDTGTNGQQDEQVDDDNE